MSHYHLEHSIRGSQHGGGGGRRREGEARESRVQEASLQ